MPNAFTLKSQRSVALRLRPPKLHPQREMHFQSFRMKLPRFLVSITESHTCNQVHYKRWDFTCDESPPRSIVTAATVRNGRGMCRATSAARVVRGGLSGPRTYHQAALPHILLQQQLVSVKPRYNTQTATSPWPDPDLVHQEHTPVWVSC